MNFLRCGRETKESAIGSSAEQSPAPAAASAPLAVSVYTDFERLSLNDVPALLANKRPREDGSGGGNKRQSNLDGDPIEVPAGFQHIFDLLVVAREQVDQLQAAYKTLPKDNIMMARHKRPYEVLNASVQHTGKHIADLMARHRLVPKFEGNDFHLRPAAGFSSPEELVEAFGSLDNTLASMESRVTEYQTRRDSLSEQLANASERSKSYYRQQLGEAMRRLRSAEYDYQVMLEAHEKLTPLVPVAMGAAESMNAIVAAYAALEEPLKVVLPDAERFDAFYGKQWRKMFPEIVYDEAHGMYTGQQLVDTVYSALENAVIPEGATAIQPLQARHEILDDVSQTLWSALEIYRSAGLEEYDVHEAYGKAYAIARKHTRRFSAAVVMYSKVLACAVLGFAPNGIEVYLTNASTPRNANAILHRTPTGRNAPAGSTPDAHMDRYPGFTDAQELAVGVYEEYVGNEFGGDLLVLLDELTGMLAAPMVRE